jgi:hypothetical protein
MRNRRVGSTWGATWDPARSRARELSCQSTPRDRAHGGRDALHAGFNPRARAGRETQWEYLGRAARELGITRDTIEEAASIEGCSRLQVLWHIYVPMARPGIIATAILSFLIAWDEFFFALVFTSTLAAKTIPVAIAEFSGKHCVDDEMIAMGGVIASLPLVLIAVIFQKYIVMGMTSGGIKE